MLDCVTEIPLPGRMFAPPDALAQSSAARTPLPAFVAGPENRLVAGAIDRLLQATPAAPEASGPKPAATSPIVLVGPSGTGKSHLAFGLVRHWQSRYGDQSALYTTAADFRHRLYDAIKRQAELEFRAEMRGCQLLAIDDLHHLPADDHVLQELRYTIDDYDDQGAVIVITSTEPISALPNLPSDLRSRLACGLLLHLAPPGDAARIRILRHAVRSLGRSISDETSERLAHGIEGTANNLFKALFELSNSPNDTQCDYERHATQLLAARAARRPTLREIISVVARHQNVRQAQLKSSSRRQSIVYARALVVFLAHELTAARYDEIGRALGGRDHTTIIHNYRKIAEERSAIHRRNRLWSSSNGCCSADRNISARWWRTCLNDVDKQHHIVIVRYRNAPTDETIHSHQHDANTLRTSQQQFFHTIENIVNTTATAAFSTSASHCQHSRLAQDNYYKDLNKYFY